MLADLMLTNSDRNLPFLVATDASKAEVDAAVISDRRVPGNTGEGSFPCQQISDACEAEVLYNKRGGSGIAFCLSQIPQIPVGQEIHSPNRPPSISVNLWRENRYPDVHRKCASVRKA